MTDMVNNPPHYTRGPTVAGKVVECIEVVRAISDYRLAQAIKYIWRVAFGGKWDNNEDIKKAIWYLDDYLKHPLDKQEGALTPRVIWTDVLGRKWYDDGHHRKQEVDCDSANGPE